MVSHEKAKKFVLLALRTCDEGSKIGANCIGICDDVLCLAGDDVRRAGL